MKTFAAVTRQLPVILRREVVDLSRSVLIDLPPRRERTLRSLAPERIEFLAAKFSKMGAPTSGFPALDVSFPTGYDFSCIEPPFQVLRRIANAYNDVLECRFIPANRDELDSLIARVVNMDAPHFKLMELFDAYFKAAFHHNPTPLDSLALGIKIFNHLLTSELRDTEDVNNLRLVHLIEKLFGVLPGVPLAIYNQVFLILRLVDPNEERYSFSLPAYQALNQKMKHDLKRGSKDDRFYASIWLEISNPDAPSFG